MRLRRVMLALGGFILVGVTAYLYAVGLYVRGADTRVAVVSGAVWAVCCTAVTWATAKLCVWAWGGGRGRGWRLLGLLLLFAAFARFGSGPAYDHLSRALIWRNSYSRVVDYGKSLYFDDESGDLVWAKVDRHASALATMAADELTRQQLGPCPWWPGRRRQMWRFMHHAAWGELLDEMGPEVWAGEETDREER